MPLVLLSLAVISLTAALAGGILGWAEQSTAVAASDQVRTVTELASNAACPAEIRTQAYWLGPTFEGLPVSAARRRCQSEDPTNPALGANNFVGFIYGDCEPSDDAGCLPPLEVQTSLTVERHRSAYEIAGQPYPSTPLSLGIPGVRQSEPAAVYDQGAIIEIYTTKGQTISVFGNDPAQVRRAARALSSTPLTRRSQRAG